MEDQAKYYYRVTLRIATFSDNNPRFKHTENFTGDNLGECREAAIKYYNEQAEAVRAKGTFFGKEIAAPTGFNYDANAAYSLPLEMVECVPATEFLGEVMEPEEVEFYLCGYHGEAEARESRDRERLIFQDMGLRWSPIENRLTAF